MKKILFLLTPFFFLTGCTSVLESSPSPLENLVQEQRELQNQQSSYFSIRHVEGDKYVILLNNPKQLAIQSVQFSFTYPDHLVELSDFEIVGENEAFPLLLGMENSKPGLQVLSMGQEGNAKKLDNVIVLGEFILKKKSDSPFQLSFFNGEKGNSIMVVEDRKIVNVLNLEELKSFTVE